MLTEGRAPVGCSGLEKTGWDTAGDTPLDRGSPVESGGSWVCREVNLFAQSFEEINATFRAAAKSVDMTRY